MKLNKKVIEIYQFLKFDVIQVVGMEVEVGEVLWLEKMGFFMDSCLILQIEVVGAVIVLVDRGDKGVELFFLKLQDFYRMTEKLVLMELKEVILQEAVVVDL